jgi:hypothetical protein
VGVNGSALLRPAAPLAQRGSRFGLPIILLTNLVPCWISAEATDEPCNMDPIRQKLRQKLLDSPCEERILMFSRNLAILITRSPKKPAR